MLNLLFVVIYSEISFVLSAIKESCKNLLESLAFEYLFFITKVSKVCSGKLIYEKIYFIENLKFKIIIFSKYVLALRKILITDFISSN